MRIAHTLAPWPEALADLTSQYFAVLADVPPDLVEIALRHVLQRCTYPPKPAELRAPIERLLANRQRVAAEMARRNADKAQQLRERDEWLAPRAP